MKITKKNEIKHALQTDAYDVCNYSFLFLRIAEKKNVIHLLKSHKCCLTNHPTLFKGELLTSFSKPLVEVNNRS